MASAPKVAIDQVQNKTTTLKCNWSKSHDLFTLYGVKFLSTLGFILIIPAVVLYWRNSTGGK